MPNRGYLAPEYALGGRLTMKADVYSYGVLTLEVVSGRTWANANHGGDQKLLAEWVCDSLQNFSLDVFLSNVQLYHNGRRWH